MADGAVVGALRVVLGLDTANFDEGIKSTQRQLQYAGSQFKRIGGEMAGIGTKLSVSITAPLLAMGFAATKGAATFETAMNKVEAATGAAGKGLSDLRDQAKAFGADKSFTSTAAEAASVMEVLAKNGLTTTQILGGATKATLMLSAATGADFAQSGDLASDVMQQFGKDAGQLEAVVDKVTGALLVSKFGFEEYKGALGQAGGVAGGLGLTFEDFNTSIAATSSYFASGSDAGTSFKTFLTRMVPTSKEAAETMKALGLNFFDAAGQMKPIGEIAEMLQQRLSGLSDQAKTEALTKMFGTDSMRTALALMDQGAAGIAKVTAEINKASAQAQMEALMKGWNGGLKQMTKAAEALAIAIGDSGLLGALSKLITGGADVVRWFAGLPGPVLKVATALLAVAAVGGPLIFVAGQIMVGWGAVLTLGGLLTPVWLAVGGALLRVAGSATIAGAAARGLGVAMSFMLGPWGLVIAGIAAAVFVLVKAIGAAKVAQEQYRVAADAVTKASGAYEVAARAAAAATKEERIEALKNAAAKREEAAQTLRAAKAKLADARAALTAARADMARTNAMMNDPTNADWKTRSALSSIRSDQVQRASQAEANAKAMEAGIGAAEASIKSADAIIAAATAAPKLDGGGGGTIDLGGGGSNSKASGRTEAELAAQREELKLQAELEAARTIGDQRGIAAIEAKLDRVQRIQAYEQAGLKGQAAVVAAERDLKVIADAKAKAQARALADRAAEVALTVAEINDDAKVVDLLTRRAEKTRLIAQYQEMGLGIVQAAAAAERDLLAIEEARLANRQRLTAEAQKAHELELARLRGDGEEAIRAKEREIELERRAREIADRERIGIDEARTKAEGQLGEEDAARVQGKWRDAIKGGFRAALEGDFGGWFKNWISEKASKGFEDALNTLSDILQKIFADVFKGMSGGSGGGWGDLLGTVVGAVIPGMGGGAGAGASHSSLKSLPGFASGGSWTVGGSGGIDSQVRAMRLTPGERVSVTKGDQETAGRMTVRVVSDDPKFRAFIEETARPMVTSGVETAVQVARRIVPADLAKSQKYQVG